MTMHPDTRAPLEHAERLAHHIDTATHRVRIIDEPPAWPTEREMIAETRGAMLVAALAGWAIIGGVVLALLVIA